MNTSENSLNENDMSLEKSLGNLSVSIGSNKSQINQDGGNDTALEQFDDIAAILKSCQPDLSRFLDRFKEAFYIDASIKDMTEADVADIFVKEAGLRPIFLKSLNKFRHQEEKEEVTKLKKPKGYKNFALWKRCVSIKWRQIAGVIYHPHRNLSMSNNFQRLGW